MNNKELDRFQVTVEKLFQVIFVFHKLHHKSCNAVMQYVNVTTAENTFTVEQSVYSSVYTWQQTLAASRVPYPNKNAVTQGTEKTMRNCRFS